jgi:hypothetical protein
MCAWLPLRMRSPGLVVAIRGNPVTAETVAGPPIQTDAPHPISFKDFPLDLFFGVATRGGRVGARWAKRGRSTPLCFALALALGPLGTDSGPPQLSAVGKGM